MSDQPLSTALHELASHESYDISISEIVRVAGSRAHGLAIFLFALPEALPLPIPSLALVFAVPLILISCHLTVFGESGTLPKRVANTRVPVAVFRSIENHASRLINRLEGHSMKRWPRLAARERLIGFFCLVLSLIMILPIPFFNMPPAICILIFAWALVQRDGAFVVAGAVMTLFLFASLALAAAGVVSWWNT